MENLETTLRNHYDRANQNSEEFVRLAKKDIYKNLDYIAIEDGFTQIFTVTEFSRFKKLEDGKRIPTGNNHSTNIRFYYKQLESNHALFISNGENSLYLKNVFNPEFVVKNVFNEIDKVQTKILGVSGAIFGSSLLTMVLSYTNVWQGLCIAALGCLSFIGGSWYSATKYDSFRLVKRFSRVYGECTSGLDALAEFSPKLFSKDVLSSDLPIFYKEKPVLIQYSQDETEEISINKQGCIETKP
ncbi:hypothetical protein JW851_03935 [Candidatus Woesearchaeota archaeon]|nr:hypothetical protein [Candidatus Woesearchaeota archaeon]